MLLWCEKPGSQSQTPLREHSQDGGLCSKDGISLGLESHPDGNSSLLVNRVALLSPVSTHAS